MKQVDEGRLLKEMLVELGRLQLETGVLARAPKKITAPSDPNGGVQTFEWTQEQEALFNELNQGTRAMSESPAKAAGGPWRLPRSQALCIRWRLPGSCWRRWVSPVNRSVAPRGHGLTTRSPRGPSSSARPTCTARSPTSAGG